MPNMNTRQWVILMLILWAGLIVAWSTLDGLPRVIVEVCIFLGFLGSSIERYRNMRRGGGR